jgi:hypothetical protein
MRAGMLVDVLAPDPSGVAAADQPLGTLTRRFLAVAEAWFGPEIVAVTTCQRCGEELEVSVPVADLREASDAAAPAAEAGAADVSVRPLTLTDLADAADADDAHAASVLLATRALGDRAPADDDEITPELIEAASAALERADPMASVAAAVTCPRCGAGSTPALDLGDWCWTMADAHVQRLLDEVDLLARAYGWSEASILALGSTRRAAYLERMT